MDILILSSGSRVKLVEYFMRKFKLNGCKVYTADCSELAPTLYVSDGYFIVPRISEKNYIDVIIEICVQNKIGAVLSLIDPELSLLARNKNLFESNNIIPIISDYSDVELCFDKYKMYQYLIENKIDTPKTFNNMTEVKLKLKQDELSLPLFCKPKNGSASLNMGLVKSVEDINSYKGNDEFIVQEYVQGKEYGIDVYIDIISGEIIEIFIKEKLTMRAGETDKSISVDSKRIKNLVKEVLSGLNLKGPIDIDIFEYENRLMISEINPRFGGGYLHAQEAGCDFINYIYNNINGEVNKPVEKEYKKSVMLKFSDVIYNEDGAR